MAENTENTETMGEKSKKSVVQKVPFHKLFMFADKLDIFLMIIGTIGAIANGLTPPLMTLIFGQLINSMGSTSPSDIVHKVSPICLEYVYLAIGSGIASLLQMTCWMVTGERQSTRIRGLYLKTILKQDISFFDTETSTGEVIGRMSGDTILIQGAMTDKVGKFIQFSSTFIGGFAIAFIKGWQLSLVLCACIPAIVIAAGTMALIMSKMASRGQIAYAQAGNVVEQTIGAIRTVVSFTGERLAINKYNTKLEIAYACTVQQGLASGLGFGILLLLVFGTYGLAIWYGATLIINHGYNAGRVINVIIAVMTGGMSLGQTSPCLSAFASGQAAAYKMFETIKRNPKIDSSDSNGIVFEHDVKGEIELKDVYFNYPARTDVQIFSGFSLNVPSGKTVALVGQSGSGKSTVISLVERFYDPDSGQVLIDGIDLKNFQLKWIRKQMGLVSQEPILFATSIKQNILYGKENATDLEISNAIELANATKFIDKLPNKLDTMVGEHGTQLSGGQKQRIAIARAILKNPKILLLDEATSALDAESERVVQDALENVITNRTTIVVAHRLSTIRNADIISVIQTGKIIEQGTHLDLIKYPDGAYSQLIRMQQGVNEETENLNLNRVKSINRNLSRSVRSNGSSNGSPRNSFESNHVFPEKEVIQEKSKVSFKRLAKLNKPEIPILLLGSIAACVHGVVFPIFGLILSSAINIFFETPHQLRKDSRFWAFMVLGLGFVTLISIPIQNYFFGVAGGRLIKRIRSLSFEKVVHNEISWFDDLTNSSGAIGARLSSDASSVRSLVGDALALIVQNLATILSGLIISFTANWILAIIVLLVLPLIGFQGFLQMKFNRGFSAGARKMYEEASQVANDAVGSIRTVASFCAEEQVVQSYEKKCEIPVKQGIKQGIISGFGLGIGSLANYCSSAFCFYIGALLIHSGHATFAQLMRVFFALTMSAMGVNQTSAMASDINKAKSSTASIFKILDRESKIDSSFEDGAILADLKGDIEFKHVSFTYFSRPDVQIFRDLCLTIPSGKTVALVGESGSGKSTVISLIERFYDPDTGNIYIDGVELTIFKLRWLREQMGLVSQEPILFNETIRDNIAYTKQGNVTEDEIITASKAANAHNFISGLPQGYDTNVGERGVQLSGGQKQRIAIARAILKDPKILLLDEATSALDSESERIVQEALEKVMVNRTTVIVAHRLTTIRNAHMIAVVKNGVISEKGTHDVLMNKRDGVYASLVALQTAST